MSRVQHLLTADEGAYSDIKRAGGKFHDAMAIFRLVGQMTGYQVTTGNPEDVLRSKPENWRTWSADPAERARCTSSAWRRYRAAVSTTTESPSRSLRGPRKPARSRWTVRRLAPACVGFPLVALPGARPRFSAPPTTAAPREAARDLARDERLREHVGDAAGARALPERRRHVATSREPASRR